MTATVNPATRSRWMALYVLCTGMLMIVLDVTIVNVALPSVQADLDFSPSGLAWVVNAYLIAFGGLLLLAGRLGDLLGRRNVFLAGLVVFTGASVLCGAAQNPATLVVARFLQGAGGAMTSAVILGMIVTMFPDPREMAKAIGVYAFVASAGGAVGLLAGGVITQAVSWHWIFFVNLPIGVVTVVLAARTLPVDAGQGVRGGADVAGAVLVTAALMLGVYTIVAPAAEHGWTATSTVVSGAVAIALLVAFVVRQATAKLPLMPLRIFRLRNVAGANIVQFVGTGAMFGSFFLGSLYLQHVLGYGPLEIGLAFLPCCLAMGLISVQYSERLVSRYGARRVLLPGMLLIVAGLGVFAVAPVDATYLVNIFPGATLMGIGAGLCFPPMMGLAMSGVAPSDAGLASGLVNTTAQVGGAIGLAVLATASTGRTTALQHEGAGMLAALTGGYHLAFWICAGLMAVSFVVALAVLREPDAGAESSESADSVDISEAELAAA